MKFEFTREWISQLKESLGTGSDGAKGEKGDKGDKGDTGAKGAKGDKGEPVKNINTGNPLKIWSGTQTEYDLVPEKDPETIYLIGNVSEAL